MAATKLNPVDVVTVGVGLTGAILAKELTDAGLKVVGLERGGYRDTHPDFEVPNAHDELKYAQRDELMQNLARETLTFRNSTGETALPMRQLGSFLPGEGVGGAAVHWNGQTWQQQATDTDVDLLSVWGMGNDLYLTGYSGAVLHRHLP